MNYCYNTVSIIGFHSTRGKDHSFLDYKLSLFSFWNIFLILMYYNVIYVVTVNKF